MAGKTVSLIRTGTPESLNRRHFPVIESLVSKHIKVAGSGEAEDNVFGFPGFPALHGLVNGHLDGVAAFRSRKDAFYPGKGLGRLEDRGLLHASGL